MPKYFKDLSYPKNFKYSSDSNNIPLEFYEETFPVSKNIDLLLGYFSSNAIKVLSKSLAEFLYSGGNMRIITNHVYSLADYENLILNPEVRNEDKMINIFKNLSEIEKNLSQEGLHFFDCLKYLLKAKRLQILPVKFNDVDLAHCKTMTLYDGIDYITTEGSINFTLSALLKNSESFQVEAPWNGEISKRRIKDARENFERIFSQNHPEYNYIDKEKIEVVINAIGRDKDISDLLDDSLDLKGNGYSEKVKGIIERKRIHFETIIEDIKNKPKFPFEEPRKYQVLAYENWLKNNRKGLFAMATGTGKTITSLNCIIEEYNSSGFYKFIVLVPTIALAKQWENETVNKFNFINTIVCSSKNNWLSDLKQYGKEIKLGIEEDICIIATYATFRGTKFQHLITNYFQDALKDFTLIADEAHTFGSPKLLEVLPHKIVNRIGLSATPERVYDPIGESALCDFFNAFGPDYTFSYNMKTAIDDKILCRYYYYPKFVDLEEYELEEYKVYTKKLYQYIDSKTGRYKDLPEVNNLLIRRKSIIHKAENKASCLLKIVDEIGSDKFKFGFIYVPEGNSYNYEKVDFNDSDFISERIIDSYATTLYKKYGFKLRKFLGETNDREDILGRFEKGDLDVLLAMKCLDEGVDVPRTQYAIFCSSTGNPRQYIQRRGRVLRTHDKKKHAFIYDMIVKPPIDHTITNEKQINAEKNILISELKRLINFAALSENKIETLELIEDVARHYGVDVYKLINEEIDKYEILK
ncbi:DEAD/DEAH box helicase family protein [Winogradskyella sp. F6397]|uniref:DEAD/DEAH box helicase family protein n=1 Tax=Winogradskyella marina TaxID=2785530 RepID=A0ABS0EF44_9FLAO|nr:DEAD/DEAH box helicase family protein [Winogradskyella marina]MBF8149075.1 DEAD/DEAH box helicase family protein [Winogradskyella marina]